MPSPSLPQTVCNRPISPYLPHFHSIAFMERHTFPMAVGAPMRTGAILVALLILPLFGVQGAALGVASLLAGFTSETVTVWWLILGKKQVRVWRTRPAV